MKGREAMKMMVVGDNLRFVKIDDSAVSRAVRKWLSDKASKQRRHADGRFAAEKTDSAPHGGRRGMGKADGFRRFFVLAKPL